jgi:predicted ATPase
MKIQIKELGALKEGTIDLSKKLIIFTGPNGTGKTYMSYLIYALTNIENKSIGSRLGSSIVNSLLTDNTITINLDHEILWNFRQKEFQTIKDNLWKLFSVAEDKADSFFKDTELNCIETKEIFFGKLNRMSINQTLRIFEYNFFLKKDSESTSITVSIPANTIKDKKFLELIDLFLLPRIFSIVAFYPITSNAIFPVERNSIYTFVKELSIKRNDAIEHIEAIATKKDANLLELYFKRSTRYPQPIRDILEEAEDIENVQKVKSAYYNFANDIEKDLLKGKIVINKDNGSVEFVSDKAPKRKLSFHQSSSIVKTLASLVIYLKHKAQFNDLVIIDEPELNLHPDNQIKLSKIFARLVNQGIRLVISTHSDYIIREFNNLLMLSSEQTRIKELANQLNYKSDEFLKFDEVVAYYFDFKKTKKREANMVEIEELNVSESGYEIPSVDETIDLQNNNSEKLYYSIKYGKDV